MEFDELDETAAGTEYEYDLDDFEAVEWPDKGEVKTVVGELLTTVENIGQYDSRAYLLENEEGKQIMVWGNSSINNQIDLARDNGLEAGDHIGIRQTGETYNNKYGTFKQFNVRFQSA